VGLSALLAADATSCREDLCFLDEYYATWWHLEIEQLAFAETRVCLFELAYIALPASMGVGDTNFYAMDVGLTLSY